MYVIRNQHIDLPSGFVPTVTDDIFSEIDRLTASDPHADITAVVDDDDDSLTVDEMIANVGDLRAARPTIGIIVVSDLIQPYMRFADDVVDDSDALPHALRSLKKAMVATKPLSRCGMQLTAYGDLTWNGETHRLTPGQQICIRAAMSATQSSIQLYLIQDKMRDIDPDCCPTLNTIASHIKNIRAMYSTPCPFFVDVHDSISVKADEDPKEAKVKRSKRLIQSGAVVFCTPRH